MARKKRAKLEYIPYASNPSIEVEEEYKLSPRVTLLPGDKFKITGERGTFNFVRYVRNNEIDAEWVDCSNAGKHRSIRPDRITKRVK